MRRPHFEITDQLEGNTAYVHTRVELYYRDFLAELPTSHNNDEELFASHIKALIWGVLYIEGLLNYKLYAFTKSRLDAPDLVERYWDMTKQARIQDKLDLMLSIDRVKRPWAKVACKKFGKMVEERNRMVHFKDVPTPFDLPKLVAKIGPNAPSSAWIEHTPSPKIVLDLLATPLQERLDLFILLGDGIERIQTQG